MSFKTLLKGLGVTLLVALTLVAAQAILAFVSTTYIIGMAILLPVTILLSVLSFKMQQRTIRRLESEISTLRHSLQVRFQPPIDAEYVMLSADPTMRIQGS